MPFLAELTLRTLTRLVALSIVLSLLVVAIEQTTGAAAPLGQALWRWWRELAALAVALVVVDTVASVEGGEALGAASLGLSRRRWRGAILLPAAAFALFISTVRLASVDTSPEPAALVVAPRAELEAVANTACDEPVRAPTVSGQTEPIAGDTRRLRAATEPWLGLLVALAALWLAPHATRSAGLGEALGRTRAVGLIATLILTAVTTAAWRVVLAMM